MSNTNAQTCADLMDINSAVDMLRDEMAANAKNGTLQVLGGILTVLIRLHPEHVEQICAPGKSLKGALGKMSEAARKIAVNGCAALSGIEGTRIALEYYGIAIPEREIKLAAFSYFWGDGVPEHNPVATKPKPAPKDFDLDALLEEL